MRTGVDTTLVAPVTLEDEAYTGANSAITKNVPPGALGIARERQVNHEGYAEPQAPEQALNSEAMTTVQPQPAPSTRLELGYDKNLMLFSGRSNPDLAARIAEKLGITPGPVTLRTFTNGEVYCRYGESIRGADVFIVQPMCANPATGMTPNDALMELLLMIDAAVGASAHRVIAVTPWFGYSRQDKKSAPREPISARLVARMLEQAGADRVLTMDLHAGQIQGFFRKPVDHMTALFILTQYFRDLGLQDLVVVAPDAGRVKLNKKFASKLGADLAILDKERPAQQVAEIGYVIGDVKGKTAVIVDDIIDTASTLKVASQTVLAAGARAVYAAATHPVLSGNAFENLAAAGLRADRRHRHDPATSRAPRQHPGPVLRRAADRLDPQHLLRSLGERAVRRGEPALLAIPLLKLSTRELRVLQLAADAAPRTDRRRASHITLCVQRDFKASTPPSVMTPTRAHL